MTPALDIAPLMIWVVALAAILSFGTSLWSILGSGTRQNAKDLFDPDHPGTGFGEKGKSRSGKRPWQSHPDPQDERERQSQHHSLGVEIGSEQQHGDDHRGHTSAGQQS